MECSDKIDKIDKIREAASGLGCGRVEVSDKIPTKFDKIPGRTRVAAWEGILSGDGGGNFVGGPTKFRQNSSARGRISTGLAGILYFVDFVGAF